MNTLKKLFDDLLVSVMLGAAVLFISCLATVGFAFVTNREAVIPGVFRAWFTPDNEPFSLFFLPNLTGMTVVIAAVAVVYLVARASAGKYSVAATPVN